MSDSLLNRVNNVKSKLLSQHTIKVKNTWLDECVKFFLSQTQIDDATLIQQVVEQFLLADVAEASNPVIPAQILQKKEAFTQHGTFVLQLLYLIDIAESPYEQWRRLHNILLDEVQENRESKAFQTKKRRMFKLELTDGYKTISAMEYVTIPSLNKKISPGTKLQVIGPIQVVNHILLLGPQNIKILGGDVDHLLIVNAYENVLLRALGKPTTDTPITEYKDENPVMETQRSNGNIVAKPMTSSTNNNISNQVNPPVSELLDGINFTEEDDVDMEMLMQIEQDERNFQANKENQRSGNPPQVELNDEDIMAQMDIDSIEQSANHRQDDVLMEVIEIRDEIPRRTPKATDLLIPPIIIPEDDEDLEINLNDLISRPTTFQNADDPVPRKVARVEPTRVPTFTSDDYRFKSSDNCNFVTIDQYLTMRAIDKMRQEYVVWGKVSSVPINTLRIKNLEWHLHGDLRDSYSNQPLPVKFHNKILEKLSGFTGAEMTAMYKQAKMRPQVKDDIHKIVESLRNKLVANLQFMKIKIEFNPDQDGPSNYELVEIIEDDEVDRQTFMKKLKEENVKKLQ